MAKSDSDVWRQFFAANVRDLVSKVLRMNCREAAKALGVDYGWLRKACSIGFVRSSSQNIEKINSFFGFDARELWTPNLMAKIQQKQKEKTVTEAVTIMPTFTPEEAKRINDVIESKQHLEYLALMMLRELRDRGLSELIQKTGDDGMMEEFFGVTVKGKQSEDPGCCTAEYHTVTSLIEDWDKTTDQLLRSIARR